MNGSEHSLEQFGEALIAGTLCPADAKRLSAELGRDEASVAELRGVLLVHGLLAGRMADPEQGLAAVKARLRRRQPTPSSSSRGRLMWAAALAASVLLAVGIAMHIANRPDGSRPPAGAPPVVRLVGGQIEGLPDDATEAPIGQALTAGHDGATLLCRDGSRLELEAGTTVTLRGETGEDRWRVDLSEGGLDCTVSDGQRPFRVSTAIADVVTEGTAFDVRVSRPDWPCRCVLVGVTEGAVRIEQPGGPGSRLAANAMRVFPSPHNERRLAVPILELVFPGQDIRGAGAGTAIEDGKMEIRSRMASGEVEVSVAPDGTVVGYSRELPGGDVPQDLPDAVRDSIERRFGANVTWTEIEVEFSKGAVFYEMELRVRGEEVEVRLDAGGNIVHEGD